MSSERQGQVANKTLNENVQEVIDIVQALASTAYREAYKGWDQKDIDYFSKWQCRNSALVEVGSLLQRAVDTATDVG